LSTYILLSLFFCGRPESQHIVTTRLDLLLKAGKKPYKVSGKREFLERKKKWRHCCRALSHGSKNSTLSPCLSLSIACNSFVILVDFILIVIVIHIWSKHILTIILSRPKQVKDVAHQDEVVRVLTNTLETTNVTTLYNFTPDRSISNPRLFLTSFSNIFNIVYALVAL
jgi:hypothetical protein